MANVTMTSVEYLELVDYARDLEQLKRDMIDNVVIEIRPDNTYRKYSLDITPTFTEDMKRAVCRKIAKAIIDNTEIMDTLYKNDSHYVDLANSLITYCWDGQDKKNFLDLCVDASFKIAWDKAERRAKEAKAKAEEEAKEE